MEFWQIDFGLPDTFDGSHASGTWDINGPELTNSSFGTYSVSGSTPIFELTESGTYKVTLSLYHTPNGLTDEISVTVKKRIDTFTVSNVMRCGSANTRPSGTSNDDQGSSFGAVQYMSLVSGQKLELSYTSAPDGGTWIIEKVG